ncbi:Lsr2 protein [Micromonospora pattaloongensis]|uniref:Lsr2 protein n=1 Tax=Micromonospora pattaloongensis TaxID=405436 RepID=A0A1H3RT66_9ACTN|nr:Lsr2 family protein [Micromonospora pattaloongensis]SDZ28862.1 Lsr2 protein [Micromonospora pattaloongensis]
MARQVIVVLTDDLDGSEADRTVEFDLDGVSYTIDLSEKHAGELRRALDPFISAGTRIGRGGGEARREPQRGGGAPTRSERDQNRAIREWAVKQGYDVSERGRIPASVVAAYNNR